MLIKARRQRLWKMFRGLHIGCNWNEEVCWSFELDSCFWPTNQCKSSFHHAWQYLAIMVTWEAVHLKSGCWGKRTLTRTKKEREEEQKSSFWRWNFCLFWPWLLAFIEPNAAFPSPFKQRIKSWPEITTVRRDGYISLRHIAGNVNKLGQTIL